MKRFAVLAVIATTGLLAAAAAQERSGAEPAAKGTPHIQDSGTEHDMPTLMRSMNAMMVKHLGGQDPQFDKRFIDLMIPHHEGAVEMAKQAMKQTDRPELKKMAEEMIAAQEKEIAQLKKWRQEWYGAEQR